MKKAPEAFRTISEVSEILETPAHVLRFWESKFYQIRPVKRAGGRRYYRPDDVALINGIRVLLQDQGMTIRGVQRVLQEQGIKHVVALGGPLPLGDPEDAILAEVTEDAAEASLDAGDDFAVGAAQTSWTQPDPGVALTTAAPDHPVPSDGVTVGYSQSTDETGAEPAGLDADEAADADSVAAETAQALQPEQGIEPAENAEVVRDTAEPLDGETRPEPAETQPYAGADPVEPTEMDATALTPEEEDSMTESETLPPSAVAAAMELPLMDLPVDARDVDTPAMAVPALPDPVPDEIRIAKRLRNMRRGELGRKRDSVALIARRIDTLLERMSEASGAGRW